MTLTQYIRETKMKDETRGFALSSREGDMPCPVLRRLQVECRLDGALFEMTLRQTYRNDSLRVLEVVYTFPMAPEVVLLGFATELNGKRMDGAVVEKREAERTYEHALEEGEAPVMLEALDDGMFTANLGNLKPGDEIVLEVRAAQFLHFEQGRLRLCIPTTIAPRYGDPLQAGLQAQQVPTVSALSEYSLALGITIAGSLADSPIECPTHRVSYSRVKDVLRLELAADAKLDRDVVVVVTPRGAIPSMVVRGEDSVPGEATVVLQAAFQVPPQLIRDRLALKLLVDCSGSMGGDSIASARRALHGILVGLHGADNVSLTRFGSSVEHALAPSSVDASTRRRLQAAIEATDATLGGTEMESALRAVFALPSEAGMELKDILLITDGEIWDSESIVSSARNSGHRVFVIGVGSSPAAGVLRRIAEGSGGACEFATPGEALEAASCRMLGRMRQQPLRFVRVEWGARTHWKTSLPRTVYGGDTVIAFAGMDSQPSVSAIPRLVMPAETEVRELACCEVAAGTTGDAVARMAAVRRIEMVDHASQKLELALAYRLMTKQTNYVLVHRRAESEKALEEVELHRVSSMLAAGWGATSTVRDTPPMRSYAAQGVVASYEGLNCPSVWRSARSRAATKIDALSVAGMDEIEIPAFLLRQVDEEEGRAELRSFVETVVHALDLGWDLSAPSTETWPDRLRIEIEVAIRKLSEGGFQEPEVWLLLAHWAISRPEGQRWKLTSTDALEKAIGAMAVERVDAALDILAAVLGRKAAGTSAKSSRTERLKRLMSAPGR